MIASILLICGIVTGILGLLDIFLTEAQKETLNNLTVRAWDKLDDAQRISLVGWLRKPDYRRWFAFAATLIGAIITAWDLQSDSAWLTFSVIGVLYTACIFVSFVVGVLIGWMVLVHVLKGGNPVVVAFRLSLYFVGCFIIVPIIVLSRIGRVAAALDLEMWLTQSTLSGLIELAWWLFLVDMLLVVYVFWLTATLPLILVSAAQAFLFATEFLVRRIAEAKKGVVLAISGILTSIGAIMKAMS
jgi:hypothetical protein